MDKKRKQTRARIFARALKKHLKELRLSTWSTYMTSKLLNSSREQMNAFASN
jgi:hypothetical protein